jgi:phasin family protein
MTGLRRTGGSNKCHVSGIKRQGLRSSPCELDRVMTAKIMLGGNMADAGGKKSGFWLLTGTNSGLHFSGPEVEPVFASQRRNVEAMMQANRLAIDGVHAVWRRQLDFIQETLAGVTTLVRDVHGTPGPLNEKFARHAEYSKQAFDRNLINARELTEIATKATTDAMNIIGKRFCERLFEVRNTEDKRSDEITSP